MQPVLLALALLGSAEGRRRLDGHCVDDAAWHKNGDSEKDCAWVGKLPASRCSVKAEDKTLASAACLVACDACGDAESCTGFPQEPIIPGMMPGTTHPRILLGIDVDYPPYATLVYPPDANDTVVGGFGPDIAKALESVCDIEMTTIQAGWGECWTDGHIGESLLKGYYHGCSTYTHTIGARNRYMEFSTPILDLNKEAGFIARLDESGSPDVSPMSDLSDVVVVDVGGGAPTADTVTVLKNDCSGEFFAIDVETIVDSSAIASCEGDYCTNENDRALKMVLNGEAHAAYIYSDQAYNYITACAEDAATAGVDCDLWNTLGQPGGYAYIQTGMPEYAYGGTTLSMSKKGSGLSQILNPCIDALIETETYYDICVKWDMVDSCFQTEHFPDRRNRNRRLSEATYNLPTTTQTGGCADGYCDCQA